MKKILFLFSFMLLGLSSCSDSWYDVNNNPDSANSTVPTAEQRLPPILAQFAYGYECAGTRVAFQTQTLATTFSAANGNYNITKWNYLIASSTTAYQRWYVYSGVNIPPMIEAAQKVDAWHYIGVGKVMQAWGFTLMADYYGNMPMDDAFNPTTFMPKYNTDKEIYEKCLPLLDEAIADLQKTQGPRAAKLAAGDIWNGGKTENWIALAYGLKARLLNHLSKRKEYDPTAILAALEKAPKDMAQSTIMQYIDEGKTGASPQQATQHENLDASTRLTKWYINLLTNNFTGGSGVLDPRIDSLVPSIQHNINGTIKKVRSVGVDMQSDLPKRGPIGYTFGNGKLSTSGKDADTIYVQLRAQTSGGRVLSTGVFYGRQNSKGLFLTHSEMAFIKAEVLFRTNKKAEAVTAYKEGIRAHMEMLKIKPADIDAFLASKAVAQNGNEITLSHIMMQKYIAMSYSFENFTDMRRNDYSAKGVYVDFARPASFDGQSALCYTSNNPQDAGYWPRRFRPCTYEVQYNLEQLLQSEPKAASNEILSLPVWWDIAN